jgi:hypothetical protein
MKDKMALLEAASNPRRATLDDAVTLSKLFASAFMDDPLFDYMVRPGGRIRREFKSEERDILRAGRVCCSKEHCPCWRLFANCDVAPCKNEMTNAL